MIKFLISITLLFSTLFSASIEDIQNINELKAQLSEIKSSSQKVEKQQKVIAENLIEKRAVGEISVEQKSEEMKGGIFRYQSDNSIVKERDSSHISQSATTLTRFGDSFFRNRNSLNSNAMPIPQNYRINKGDIVSVWLYGGRNRSDKLEVDRNGNINIDGVGPLYIYGLEFRELQTLLSKKYGELYKSAKIHIDLDRTTPIQITIAGEVNSPGIYNISAFSTIKDALIIANGIDQYGSYRGINILRDGKILKTFDIYKLMINGDTSYLSYILNSGDAIIVPRAKRVVSISGEVKKSGIYELKRGENLNELMEFAGGLKVTGSNTLAKLVRFDENRKRVVKEIKLSKDYTLLNGDRVVISPINTKNSDSIYIYGNVVHIGERGFFSGLTLFAFFEREIREHGLDNVFLKNSEMNYSVIKRYNQTEFEEEIIQFSLSDILAGKKDIKLQKGDEIYIFNRAELKENPYIYIHGSVITNPGKYQYFDNMTLGDIESFSKFKSETVIDGKRRYLKVSTEVKLLRNIRENMEIHFLDLNKDENFSISPFDEITFYDKLERETPKYASIKGEVLSAGKFRIDENTTLNKLVQLAKGLTKEAYLNKFELIRYRVVNGEREYEIIERSLEEALNSDFQIQEFDEVTIFKIPNWSEREVVEIRGEVKFPGFYTIQKGDTLQKIIERAGGYLDTAFLDGAVFTRTSIQKLQEKRLLESIRQLKQDSLYLLSSPNSMGESSGDKSSLLKMIDSLVAELSKFKPNGRVSVDLKNENNFILENGDKIYIPTVNETVTVIGEVLNPNSFFYVENYSVEDYLERSGGLNSKADIDNIYIVHPNGEAERYEQSYLFGSSNSIRIGDSIIIPMRIETSSYSTVAKDVSQILYQFAITAVSIKTVGVF